MNEAERLILDLLSPLADIGQRRLDGLSVQDWDAFDASAQRQRLKPMLHWMVANHHAGLAFPADMLDDWESQRRRSNLRALGNLAELLNIAAALEQAGIPCLALKGAYLAYFAYPEPNLRPMRDIDILVPQGQLRAAFDTLLRHGAKLVGKHGHEGTIDAAIDLDVKHLPPLIAPGGRISIEVHNYLFSVDITQDGKPAPELSRDAGFWDRSQYVEVSNRRIRFYSREDLLLHIIVHAVYDHRFDNGPLLLSDIAFLLKAGPVDWDAFWSMAERLEKLPACKLALELTESLWGGLGVDCPTPRTRGIMVGQDLLEHAKSLMFYDIDNKFGRNLSLHLNAEPTFLGKLGYIARRIFRPRTQVASMYNANPRSPLIFRFYVLMYIRLVSQFFRTRLLGRNQKAQESRTVAGIESINSYLEAHR